MDRSLRQAARADLATHLRARLRAGELSPLALEVAAALGEVAAAEALGVEPRLVESARELGSALAELGREASVRAVLACSEAVGVTESREPYSRQVALKITGQIRAWLRDQSPRHERALADLDSDFLSWFAEGYWLAALLDCATEAGFQERLAHVLETADQNLGPLQARAALEDLVPWLIGAEEKVSQGRRSNPPQ